MKTFHLYFTLSIEYLAFLSAMGYVRQVDAESFIQNFFNVETFREAIGLE
ncbi:MAG: hypothetical protein KAU17_05515 [Spirochaetales bacterium]|jgi:hypothetical protein|nr:hypothetical protein [Spirochaetales bacterium]